MQIEETPTTGPATSSVKLNRRNSLRGATDHLHRDLDRIAAGFNLADATHYRRFLQANAATLIAIEQLLETAGVDQLLPDWHERSRRAAILTDLQSLQSDVQPLALRRTAPTPPEVFGILYVLEGSRLGARVQLDQVLASADENVRNASSYLSHGQPGEGSNLWRSFLEHLETHEAADDQTQTVSGAVYAFTMFIRSFSQAANDLRLRTAPAA
ncbi:heme oxygenase [Steroidobacter agaridevorans]|uniref:Heme oxygenase n=1 Tax=Steroidobacter agaridevorans TaxID=2695856 RepID=A0A829YFQ4_9GAMM|nr:biliverdin-producing heme oxygenase [Steroidobacter agaridevorans]GFE81462.1 heme oxygenase [Steroidobacter agaridevorans]GFE90207.1 heme oxygenase [Steroidobacter agaridevorans]